MKIHTVTKFIFFVFFQYQVMAQTNGPEWSELPPLPDKNGFAGMYAGVSSGKLIVMGGANFPDKMPWESGKKKWYDSAFILSEDGTWRRAAQVLPEPSGYGVTVSYNNRMVLVGGSNLDGHLSRVISCELKGDDQLAFSVLPSLPSPLANMAGTLLGSVVVIFGGMETPTGNGVAKTYLLDLEDTAKGWQDLSMGDIAGRIFPVCGVFKNTIYMMGGETRGINSLGKPYRRILLDAYALTLEKVRGYWKPLWKPLVSMPRGVSAGGGNLPLLNNDRFLIWGGVDAVTAEYRDAKSHPGITKSLLYYFPETDSWESLGDYQGAVPRVTLPVVHWKNRWIYVSGEVKPGIRTPSLIGVQ